MIDSILKTFPDDVALASNTVVRVVVRANPVVLPNIEFTATIFGFAIFYLLVNYYPKTNAKAIDFPAEIPVLAWKDGVVVVPLDVNMKPAVVLVIPPKEPLLLNCTCVLDPPGVVATAVGTAEITEVVEGSTIT
jgi:hypothetical protein